MSRSLALTKPGMSVVMDMVVLLVGCLGGRRGRRPPGLFRWSGDDLGTAGDGGLAGEVDGGPVEQLAAAVVARQLHGVRAADESVRELRAHHGFDVVPDAVVVAGTAVAGLQVH